jgi:DNA repair protein RadC
MTVIPRMDVKPLARMLLQRFGSLPGVFNADPRALQSVPGIKEAAAAALRIAGSPRAGSPARKSSKCPCCRAGRP